MIKCKRIMILMFGAVLLTAQADLPERLLHYRPGDWISYPVLRYVSSAALGDEFVYFGTTGGILRYQFFERTWYWPFTESDGLQNGRIQNLIYDFNTGFLWCATETGIISFREPSSEYWRNISNAMQGEIRRLGIGNKYIWAEDQTGYHSIDRTSGSVWPVSAAEMRKDQVRWAEKNGSGIDSRFFVDPAYMILENGIQDANFREYPFTDAVQDQYNHRWLGTWGLGTAIAEMDMLTLTFHQIGPYASDIQVMAWDEHGMWMGGLPDSETPHGITYWDMADNTWRYYESVLLSGLRSDAVNSIAVDGIHVWFGTLNGLAKYDSDRDTWKTYSQQNNLWDERITCLALDDSTLWVGTVYGINRIDLNSNRIKKITDERLVHSHIFEMDVDPEGAWAATDRGIYRYLSMENRWQFMEGYGGMLTYTVTAVAVYGPEVWFGTDDGVEIYNKESKQWTGFPSVHYPTGSHIHTILPDDTAVWFGTDQGVLKYIREEDRWHAYTTDDGLLDNDVRWILLDGDDIWFGTARGLTKFFWNAPYRID
ncbi:hypothetical protein JW835_00215 [bacterium]|nr:hypothetical protein [bacterium]